MNINIILGRTKDLEERLCPAEEQIDDIEQYSQRNCLVFLGIDESHDENSDLIVETCNTNLSIDLAVEDIKRSHRLGLKTLKDVATDGNSLGKSLKSSPIIVKFMSYQKQHEVFSAEKKLKGKKITIVKNIMRTRQRIFNVARETVSLKNSWIQDEKIFAKRTDDNKVFTLTKERDLHLINGQLSMSYFYQNYYWK